jgi:hypothetical protein
MTKTSNDNNSNHPEPRRKLTVKNVDIAFGTNNERYPQILSLKEAAEIAKLSPATLKRHVSEGRYANCVSRGKPLRFFRNWFVLELMRPKQCA